MKKVLHKLIMYPLSCLLFFLGFSLNSLGQRTTFQAGASMSNITPKLGLEIVGNYNSQSATYVHDQLHARTLVLDDGIQKLVFVLVDNVSVKQEVFDAARTKVHDGLGIPKSNILMAATHTHSGTSAGKQGEKRRGWHQEEPLDDYQDFLVTRIVDGVRIAVENLEPARIAWGSVNAPEHVFNRRWIMREEVWSPLGFKDKAKMNPGVEHPDLLRPAGPVDPEVSFIAVESLNGKPISVLGNYSLHYVGGVPKGHISADYFAVFGDRIQELLEADRQDPPFVGILSNGTSGDVNNIDWLSTTLESREPYYKIQYVANDIAEKVIDIYRGLEFRDWVPLDALETELTLKVRKASLELLANVEKVEARPENDVPIFHSLEKIYAKRIRQMEAEWPDQVKIVLQCFRIGDLGIAAIPFEVFAETGLEIKEKSPFAKSFTIELANGSYGYLPTPEQDEVGGYETWLTTNKVEKGASRKIVSVLMDLFNELKSKNEN